jgi:hypothetical protein
MCHATMNMVIAIDGSGSSTEKGLAVFQNTTQRLVTRFSSRRHHDTAVMVGILHFGKVRLKEAVLSDGVKTRIVSHETLVLPLTGDMDDAMSKLELKHQTGFTNFA